MQTVTKYGPKRGPWATEFYVWGIEIYFAIKQVILTLSHLTLAHQALEGGNIFPVGRPGVAQHLGLKLYDIKPVFLRYIHGA